MVNKVADAEKIRMAFRPQADISAYELAFIWSMVWPGGDQKLPPWHEIVFTADGWSNLPENLRRHFVPSVVTDEERG